MKKLRKEHYVIAILLICFICLTAVVISGKTAMIDEFIYNGLIGFKSEPLTIFFYVVTTLGSTIGIAILLFVTMIIFIRKKSISDFKYVLINVASGVLIMQGLKTLIRRSRPIWKWIVEDGFSYPSGHTITSFMFYGTLMLLISKKVKGKWKTPLMIICSVMIFMTGLSRIYFGVHYVTDVLASIILGGIILFIANTVMNKEFEHDKNKA